MFQVLFICFGTKLAPIANEWSLHLCAVAWCGILLARHGHIYRYAKLPTPC
jgi:hypothetical protein